MNYTFEINCFVLNTGMAKAEIEKQVQERYDLVYGANKIIFNYELLNDDEVIWCALRVCDGDESAAMFLVFGYGIEGSGGIQIF